MNHPSNCQDLSHNHIREVITNTPADHLLFWESAVAEISRLQFMRGLVCGVISVILSIGIALLALALVFLA